MSNAEECVAAKSREFGFTLIEVALAVAILGVALTTLVSLQSSYLRAYQQERSLVKAALIGQYLLAAWEADDNLPTPGESTKPLRPILEKLGYFEDNDMVAALKPEIEDWTLHRRVTNVGIPPVESALKKMEVEIVWGPGPGDLFPIVYFVKGIKLPDDSEADQADDDQSTDETGAEEDEADEASLEEGE